MPANPDHKAIPIATIDPYAVDRRKKRPDCDFSAAVQREVLAAARRQMAGGAADEEQTEKEEKASP